MYYHKTKDGKKIRIDKLSDFHLINIIKYIKKRAKEGITIFYGGGYSADEMWGDEKTIYGKEALDEFNYDIYNKELKRRKLII